MVFLYWNQTRNFNPVEYLRCSILRKQLTVSSCYLFSQNPQSYMFDKVLNTRLKLVRPPKFFLNKMSQSTIP